MPFHQEGVISDIPRTEETIPLQRKNDYYELIIRFFSAVILPSAQSSPIFAQASIKRDETNEFTEAENMPEVCNQIFRP